MSDALHRPPPQNLDAERAVLGSMIRANAIIPDVTLIVCAEHFYTDAHQKIFRVMVALDNQGQPVDLVLLSEALKERQQLEDVGGYGYLGTLLDAAPTAANVEYYARIVRDLAIVRNLVHASNEILRDAFEQTAPAAELLETAERKILVIAETGTTDRTVRLRESMQRAQDRLDARLAGNEPVTGIPTGFELLDAKLVGLRSGELIVVGARPSMGKTAFGVCLARHAVAELGVPVLFVSLEQSEAQITERMLCCQARLSSHEFRHGAINQDEIRRLLDAERALQRAEMLIDDATSQTVHHIAANARRLKRRQGIRLVVIDYLQFIEPESRKLHREQQVAAISKRLKQLARELQIPVVTLAQLNRQPASRGDQRPRLSDLRESGQIEMDADVALLLDLPEKHDPPERPFEADVIISKQRDGPTGTVVLGFRKDCMRFENLADMMYLIPPVEKGASP